MIGGAFINGVGCFLLVATVIGAFLLRYILSKNKKHRYHEVVSKETMMTFEELLTFVKNKMDEWTQPSTQAFSMSEEAYLRQLNKRSALKKALRNCAYGSIEDKGFVKDMIYDLLRKSEFSLKQINRWIPFENSHLMDAQTKFEILLSAYQKRYGAQGLSEWISKYQLDVPRTIIEDGTVPSYIITTADIEAIYETEGIRLSQEDKLRLLTQRIYQMYKGFGVVDEIRDMAIDGVSGGVSGVLSEDGEKHLQNLPKNYDSVWIFYKGKPIHLAFLSFGSDNELRRICQNIYRYNKAGQLSENVGYKVNEMKDGSRVVVVRPSFSESWAFFVRKFHIQNVALDELIQDPGKELPIQLMKYLMKGARVVSVTGAQGTGKTTLLMALVKHIYGTLTLRIQEMSFELHLRKVYPMRNILTFKETTSISGQQGLDLQKKTDGAVNILGEVASDEVAAWMIGLTQVASLFTVFTHHAKTTQDLILSLRNSLLKCQIFRDEKVSEQQVVQALDFDIHLEKDYSGKRYISRITQIIAVDQDHNYPKAYQEAIGAEERWRGFMDVMSEYFTRQTDRVTYEVRNIMEYVNGQYVVTGQMTPEIILKMHQAMTREDQSAFESFLSCYWEDARWT